MPFCPDAVRNTIVNDPRPDPRGYRGGLRHVIIGYRGATGIILVKGLARQRRTESATLRYLGTLHMYLCQWRVSPGYISVSTVRENGFVSPRMEKEPPMIMTSLADHCLLSALACILQCSTSQFPSLRTMTVQ